MMMIKDVHIPTIPTLLRLILIIVVFLLVSATTTSASFDLVSSLVNRERNDDRTTTTRSHLDDLMISQHKQQHDLLTFHRIKKPLHQDISAIVVSTSEEQKKKDPLAHHLLDDLMIENEKDFNKSSSFHRMTLTKSTSGCVRNQNGIKNAIINAPDYSSIPTNINICKENILIDASMPDSFTGERGIHVVNKFINFRCIINKNKKCKIDAQRMSRHFFIMNSTVLFNRITLLKGREDHTEQDAIGGSILIRSSNIIMNHCDFMNSTVKTVSNSIYRGTGGAIYCDKDCNMKLININMINNNAYGIASYGIGGTGGAIYCSTYGNIQMFNVTFTNNTSEDQGGAIDSYGIIDINNVSFAYNTAGTAGGAVALYGATSIINSLFINNKAVDRGGAIQSYGILYMMNVSFTNNNIEYGGLSFASGGALYSFGIVDMTNALFTNNTATYGGAADFESREVRLVNVTFINNTAYYGGAIYSETGNITMDNATMVNNRALFTGGAVMVGNNYAKITNSFLQSNTAEYEGGAVHASYGTVMLHNVVLTNNSARRGILTLSTSKADLNNALFSSTIGGMDECDIFFGTWGVSDAYTDYYVSQLNLRQSPPGQTQQQQLTTQENFVDIVTKSSPEQQPSCVTTYVALRKQVRLCNNPCAINICQDRIQMNNSTGRIHPINLSNKNILIKCQLNSYERCAIDGQGLSRIFDGSNVTVTFQNIIFANGYSSVSGGALDLKRDSFVNLLNCTFVNNSAATGAAIMITDTAFYMTGTHSSFINNTGSSPALVAYSSDLNLYDTLFEGNMRTKYGNGIFLFDSTIQLFNNTFSEPKKTSDNDCNVFVAVNPNKIRKGATCLDVSSVLQNSL